MQNSASRSQKPLLQLRSKLMSIRRKHLLKAWLTFPVVLFSLILMNCIIVVWVPDLPIWSGYYIAGMFLIVSGSGFLIAYNYLSASKVDIFASVTEATLIYLGKVKRQIQNKLFLLLVTSSGFCLFLSAGIHLMIFRWLNSDIRGGVVGAYYGSLIALYGWCSGIIIKRFHREYRPILSLIRAIRNSDEVVSE